MNTIMLGVLVVGALGLQSLRREIFPEFELEMILVTVAYPGASPEEVEDGVCRKIEEAVRSIDGIEKQTAVAREGAGFLVLELRSDVRDVQKVLSEVRSEIDRIPSFPVLAEDPEIKQITFRTPAINVAVLAPEDSADARGDGKERLPFETDSRAQLHLREVAEQVREELLQLSEISQANILGALNYQIDIEISEDTLRKHGLTLQQVAQIVRRENLEMPGGNMKTESQTVLLRGKNKRITGSEIAEIPLITQPNGQVLRVRDLGVVRDEFEDIDAINRINGRPGLVISVDRTAKEDLLAITQQVRQYVEAKKLPGGYEVMYYSDRSIDVQDRLDLLVEDGLQGLVLVFIALAMFLNLRTAFWVGTGIPVALLGACAVLLFAGQTLNMLTMFAFIMAMGIVVDDAIVISDNIYAHYQMGKSAFRAAVEGAAEVIPSVLSSVTLTVVAFLPLLFVSGVMGKFIAAMPLTMIAILLISLAESVFILPCHLAHEGERHTRLTAFLMYPFVRFEQLWQYVNRAADRFLNGFIERIYLPTLEWALTRPALVGAGFLALLLTTIGLWLGGFTPWELFPKLDSKEIFARVEFPDGTPSSITNAATTRIEQELAKLNRELSGNGKSLAEGETSLVKVIHRSVGQAAGSGALGQEMRASGDHVGVVNVELIDPGLREVHSDDILAMWSERVGQIPGVESLTFDVPEMGPGGKAIEFKLLADAHHFTELEAAVESVKTALKERVGVRDVVDDSKPGKVEYQLQIKDRAQAMGVPLAEVAETVRAAYYGEEVMRLQRGRHEVKLMVRYPRDERGSLANFEEIRIRAGDGAERPITELAHVDVKPSLAEINRVDQMRSITVSADVTPGLANARAVVADLQATVMPEIFAKNPHVQVRWEGQQEQTDESVRSLLVGLVVAMVTMFVLLTIEFRSYLQPLMIMAIIPFGIAGAVWGHFFFGLPLSMFSLFGLVALTGVVVNDSIVLIDFINHRLRDGLTVREALFDAGRRRFRPVMLVSVTTIVGLLPIVMETSLQAQIIIPMAIAFCFGEIFSTVLVLIMVPLLFQSYANLVGPQALALGHVVHPEHPAAPGSLAPAGAIS
jgi:multidrug efflux pump subunit AcrB